MDSEDDLQFLVESRMRVHEPADHTNSCAPKRPALLSTPPKASIPEETVQILGEILGNVIQGSNSDSDIQYRLPVVWVNVNNALQEDEKLKTLLANQEEFKANVEKEGKQQFIDLLKDMAKKKNWRDLFDNSVFYKQEKSDWSLSTRVG